MSFVNLHVHSHFSLLDGLSKANQIAKRCKELGQTASQEAGWNGVDALDGIAFELKTRGFVELAKKIQSVIKENKSTRLKDLV